MAAGVMEVEACLYGQDGFNLVISNAGMVSIEGVQILNIITTLCGILRNMRRPSTY